MTAYYTTAYAWMECGKLTLRQEGRHLTGDSMRTETRQGLPSDRRFVYRGQIVGNRVDLLFEDARGKNFDSGSYIFCVHNDYVIMEGFATFHGKPEGRIVSEKRGTKENCGPFASVINCADASFQRLRNDFCGV
jgi:hypothetical protein